MLAKSFCAIHYARARRGKPMDAPVGPRHGVRGPEVCSVATCGRSARSLGMCGAHYERSVKGAPMDVPVRPLKPKGSGHLLKQGYITRKVAGEKFMEHRKVMEGVLGRPLLPHENVHHKNGVRHDNRPENLELWVKTQPCGQRATDLIGYAHEILFTYTDARPIEIRNGVAFLSEGTL